MNFAKPAAAARRMAGGHPVVEDEAETVIELYRAIVAVEVRQAILDALVAIAAA